MEGAFWCPYNHRIVHLMDKTKYPDWLFSATKIEVCGTKGIMFFGRHGGGWQVFEGELPAEDIEKAVGNSSLNTRGKLKGPCQSFSPLPLSEMIDGIYEEVRELIASASERQR